MYGIRAPHGMELARSAVWNQGKALHGIRASHGMESARRAVWNQGAVLAFENLPLKKGGKKRKGPLVFNLNSLISHKERARVKGENPSILALIFSVDIFTFVKHVHER